MGLLKIVLTTITGKHPCLWCTATTDMIKIRPDERTQTASARTLDTLKADFKRFQGTYKSNLQNAMKANNVIHDALFDIPLDQVKNNYCHFSDNCCRH